MNKDSDIDATFWLLQPPALAPIAFILLLGGAAAAALAIDSGTLRFLLKHEVIFGAPFLGIGFATGMQLVLKLLAARGNFSPALFHRGSALCSLCL